MLGYKFFREAIKNLVNQTDIKQLDNINCRDKTGHPNKLYLNTYGVCNLIIKSKMANKETLCKWFIHKVLPAVNDYDVYQQHKKTKSTIKIIDRKINYLKNLSEELKNMTSLKKYPKGAIVYTWNCGYTYTYLSDSSGDDNKNTNDNTEITTNNSNSNGNLDNNDEIDVNDEHINSEKMIYKYKICVSDDPVMIKKFE